MESLSLLARPSGKRVRHTHTPALQSELPAPLLSVRDPTGNILSCTEQFSCLALHSILSDELTIAFLS